ncbi:hypothetical protein [Catalinimonas niigatensis]|uniref:hypothetical protein n=1 Tax=Catalinimonas niigatensis TaxID=1397264 RepID=UPI0026654CCE|nr:hypothetical protein [Catalinimonas niigatensis]WPP50265.1 hypothetical protein PZB72_26730 [Catalinimonas niigatensis]
MYLIRVTDHNLASEFVSLPARLSHLHVTASKSRQKHVRALINRKATFFQSGKAEFWILTNFRGETIGRIAAFVEHPDQPEKAIGFIGLFECINHLKAASLLFDECKEWLKRFGVNSMQGPVSLLPFQLEGIALGTGFQQATPFFSSQADYLVDLYEFYGFKVWNTQQLLSLDTVSSSLQEEDKVKAEVLFSNNEYEFLKIKKNEIREKAGDIETIYKASLNDHSPVPSTEDIMQWLNLLFEQHFPPLIWMVYHKKMPIAFFVNTFISTNSPVLQNTPLWQQLISRLTTKSKSLLNLGLLVHPEFQTKGINVALLSTLDKVLANEPASHSESFLIMSDHLEQFQISEPSREVIDKFVKYKYVFDQESLIGTFAKSKIVSRE